MESAFCVINLHLICLPIETLPPAAWIHAVEKRIIILL